MKTFGNRSEFHKFFKIRKYSVKFLRFIRRHSIALVALCISIIGSSPITSRFLIYFLYEPKLDIVIAHFGNATINWSEIFRGNEEIAGIAINNKDPHRYMYVEMEIIASKPLRPRPQFVDFFIEKSVCRDGFLFKTDLFYLPANGGGGPAFPFERYNETVTLKITIYPKMKMDEFGLPRFFGDIDLRPFTKTFTIEP